MSEKKDVQPESYVVPVSFMVNGEVNDVMKIKFPSCFGKCTAPGCSMMSNCCDQCTLTGCDNECDCHERSFKILEHCMYKIDGRNDVPLAVIASSDNDKFVLHADSGAFPRRLGARLLSVLSNAGYTLIVIRGKLKTNSAEEPSKIMCEALMPLYTSHMTCSPNPMPTHAEARMFGPTGTHLPLADEWSVLPYDPGEFEFARY